MNNVAEQLAGRLQSNSLRMLRLARRDAGGLSGPRLAALSTIAHTGPTSLARLAAAEGVSPPTMTRLVDSLIEAGLAARETDPTDRRAIRISATEAGMELLRAGEVRSSTVLATRLTSLAHSERRALARGLELMERLLRAA